MRDRFLLLAVGLLIAPLAVPVGIFAQNYAHGQSADGWPQPVWDQPPVTSRNSKPARRHDLTRMWGPAAGHMGGVQAGGVLAKPNNGKPENQLPYTPYGLQVYRSHKPAEGIDAVLPAGNNDPRKDDTKVVILYHYDNRWRVIWTDGRKLPEAVDGGVEIDGEFREERVFGYSVGRWIDDNTLEVQTVGTLAEDRVWLDSTGRPISDRARIIETLRRVDSDDLEWSETIDDPKMYTMPWQTMKLPMRLHDPHTDIMGRGRAVGVLQSALPADRRCEGRRRQRGPMDRRDAGSEHHVSRRVSQRLVQGRRRGDGQRGAREERSPRGAHP